jgi:hypothetical protein
MSTAHVDQTIDDAFLDLVSRDDDLVRAEFDGLVAACWQDPPPSFPAPPRPHGRPPAWPAPPPAQPPAPAPVPPPAPARGRQRSPPTEGR